MNVDVAQALRLTIPSGAPSLATIREMLGEFLRVRMDPREAYAVILAVDEAVSNVIEHGYGLRERGVIELVFDVQDGVTRATVRDRGPAFDPTAVAEPEMGEHVRAGRTRGLGLMMMKRVMDRVEYRRTDDGNELIMEKKSCRNCRS